MVDSSVYLSLWRVSLVIEITKTFKAYRTGTRTCMNSLDRRVMQSYIIVHDCITYIGLYILPCAYICVMFAWHIACQRRLYSAFNHPYVYNWSFLSICLQLAAGINSIYFSPSTSTNSLYLLLAFSTSSLSGCWLTTTFHNSLISFLSQNRYLHRSLRTTSIWWKTAVINSYAARMWCSCIHVPRRRTERLVCIPRHSSRGSAHLVSHDGKYAARRYPSTQLATPFGSTDRSADDARN